MFTDKIIFEDHNSEVRVTDASGKPKLLWQETRLGAAVRRLTGTEVRIPGLTGHKSYVSRSHNLVTNLGHQAAAARLGGIAGFNAASYLALGTGTTAPAVTDTAMESELTGGLARTNATVTQVTTNVTNDTLQLSATWTATADAAVTEEGIFDAASGGRLIAHQTRAAINLEAGDSITWTHKVSL